MIRINKSMLFLMAAALGVWGCSNGKPAPVEGREAAAHARALESKLSKMEEEARTLQAARDHLRQKLDSMERERNHASRQAQVLARERNDIQVQLTVRTTERDAVQSQYESFRKEIRNLLGQADAAAPAQTLPVTDATAPHPPGKSSRWNASRA